MNPQSLPVVGTVFEMGADDLLFDSLLLAGPVLVLLIVLGGRQSGIVALACGYLLVFLAKIGYNFRHAT